MRLLLTHGTATGREAGRALLREGDRQTWLPYDTPGAARRFLARFRPAVGVLMETEVWPNLLLAAQAQRVPMVLANARLSERSLRPRTPLQRGAAAGDRELSRWCSRRPTTTRAGFATPARVRSRSAAT